MRVEEKFDFFFFLQQFFFGCILYHYSHLSFVFVYCRSNCVPHKDMWKSQFLISMNMTMFGNRAFADRTKWRSHVGFQFSLVAQLCLTLCNPMNLSMPGLPVHHQLQEFTQINVYWVGDAIQPSHPLSSRSPPALNLSQHQGLLQWVFASGGQSIGVSASTSVLPMNTQDWSPLG